MEEEKILEAVELAIENARRYMAERKFVDASVSLAWAADELKALAVENGSDSDAA